MSFFSRLWAKPSPPAAAPAPMILAHPTLGDVTVSHSPRAKRLSISVRSTAEVRLIIPRGVSDREALRFLDTKKAWVGQAQERARIRNPRQIIGPSYATRSHTLRLDPRASRSIRAKVGDGSITVSYPAGTNYESAEVQEAIKQGIEEAWRREAREYLPARTAEICRRTGFRCGTVTVRNARTRWGSCTADNNLSLSIHLMKLPDHLIDYVILHELCHTHHKNHGPKFHALLDKVSGGKHAALRKELKSHTTRW